jgi:NADH:ubiquinone oxidoreductase subunit E
MLAKSLKRAAMKNAPIAHREIRSAVIPLLELAQTENDGFLNKPSIHAVSGLTQTSAIDCREDIV